MVDDLGRDRPEGERHQRAMVVAADDHELGVDDGGPEIDGLIVIPAVLTGLVLGLLADAFVRYIALEPA